MDRDIIAAKLSGLRVSVMPLLEYSQRELRDYTVHGYMHSENVEKILLDIISRCNAKGGDCTIDSLEEYILMCAAWLHDTGNIIDRKTHNDKSCKIIDVLVPGEIEGVETDHKESIKWICFAHPRLVNINDVPLERTYRGTTIRLRYLTAIFRIADAADMNAKRAPVSVYKVIEHSLQKKSKKIWKSYHAIRDVSFMPSENSIIVTVTDKRKAASAVKELTEELEGVRAVLEQYSFPYTGIRVVREDRAPYRGRLHLS